MHDKKTVTAEQLRTKVIVQHHISVHESKHNANEVSILIKHLEATNRNTLERAATLCHIAALGEHAAHTNPELLPALRYTLADQDSEVRELAVEAVMKMDLLAVQYPGMMEALSLRLHDTCSEVVDAALKAFRVLPWRTSSPKDQEAVKACLPEFFTAPVPSPFTESTSVWLMGIIASLRKQPRGGYADDVWEPLKRPDDTTSLPLLPPNSEVLENEQISWHARKKEDRKYIVLFTEKTHLRGSAWRVSLNDGQEGFVLLSAPSVKTSDSWGFLILTNEAARPERITRLESISADDKPILEKSLKSLAQWDNAGIEAWQQWGLSQEASLQDHCSTPS